jgi:hypothetical protein
VEWICLLQKSKHVAHVKQITLTGFGCVATVRNSKRNTAELLRIIDCIKENLARLNKNLILFLCVAIANQEPHYSVMVIIKNFI